MSYPVIGTGLLKGLLFNKESLTAQHGTGFFSSLALCAAGGKEVETVSWPQAESVPQDPISGEQFFY